MRVMLQIVLEDWKIAQTTVSWLDCLVEYVLQISGHVEECQGIQNQEAQEESHKSPGH